MRKILDVGCGNNKMDGAIGIDRSSCTQADIIHDLNKSPWPFPDNEFDEIVCMDILEHLDDVISIMEEICRIAKPNATIRIRVPHFSSSNTYVDITHKRSFSIRSFNYFVMDEFNHRYSTKVKLKNLNAKIYFPRIYKLIEILANLWPDRYERYLAYIFPASNVEFEFTVLK